MRPSLRMPLADTRRRDSLERMEHLPGGSGGVWRADDPVHGPVVHRPTGPWTPAVHDLLAFLAAAGLDGVPRVLGFDDEGREVLTYLAGAPSPSTPSRRPTRCSPGCRTWLRRFHDVVRGYDPGPRVWRQTRRALAPGQLVCHNDTGALQLDRRRTTASPA